MPVIRHLMQIATLDVPITTDADGMRRVGNIRVALGVIVLRLQFEARDDARGLRDRHRARRA